MPSQCSHIPHCATCKQRTTYYMHTLHISTIRYCILYRDTNDIWNNALAMVNRDERHRDIQTAQCSTYQVPKFHDQSATYKKANDELLQDTRPHSSDDITDKLSGTMTLIKYTQTIASSPIDRHYRSICIRSIHSRIHFLFFLGSGGSSAARIASSNTFFRPFC